MTSPLFWFALLVGLCLAIPLMLILTAPLLLKVMMSFGIGATIMAIFMAFER